MSDAIEHISDTAFWVAAFRAKESERPDALFRDPLAARMIEGRGSAIAARMGNPEMIAWTVAIRTRLIDEYVQAAIADGCDTVLNLGAGLDTRPYRMELPPTLDWIEVDLSESVDFKEQRLHNERLRCRLRRIKLDLTSRPARSALFDEIDGRSARVLVITEGVVPYLRSDDVADLAADLHARSSFTWWILEYFSAQWTRMNRFMKQQRQVRREFRPGDWHRFFADRGWRARAVRYLHDEGKRLNRPAPIRLWARLAMALVSSEKRRAMQTMFGYALMEKARTAGS